MSYIRIKNVAIYHPEKSVSNDFYLKHFQEKKGKNIQNFLNVMGRKERYLIDNDEENGLTMGIEAARRVLQKANLSGKDMDMIVFSTQIPETTYPTNAVLVHQAIEANNHTIVLDSNANCAGMSVAVDQASRYMLSNPYVKKALIVGSDYNSLLSSPDDEITYANYGDAAAAVILEKTEENTGFIDSIYYTDPMHQEFINYPANGLSKTLKGTGNGRYIKWLPFDASDSLPPTYNMINQILERNNLKVSDIKSYCFSQFALGNILKIQENLKIEDKQITYVGDRFGYTGTSSPFIAFHEAIETDQIQRGDYVLFWTVGAGFELIAILFKY
ncbi:ketoacyl-ACP synthase III [Peribacillus sp. NPDC097197]|uniref:ketoacyl-ACP synthase III n=1 Tax=Peribacillus sp. NPDC097197 TaxID=3390615 RepID=UPI003D04A435